MTINAEFYLSFFFFTPRLQTVRKQHKLQRETTGYTVTAEGGGDRRNAVLGIKNESVHFFFFNPRLVRYTKLKYIASAV